MKLLDVIQKSIIGCDVDNTLTDLPPFDIDNMDLEETRQLLRNAPSKKGIEILSILNINPVIITGRGDYFHEDTVYWLNRKNVKPKKVITIDRKKYPGNRFNLHEYLNYKLNAYIENGVKYCLEDDVRVIKKLEKHGIKCSLVKDDFEKAFWTLFNDIELRTYGAYTYERKRANVIKR